MCRKDRGDEAIGERDILVTGPDSYREALIGQNWRSSVQVRCNDLALLKRLLKCH